MTKFAPILTTITEHQELNRLDDTKKTQLQSKAEQKEIQSYHLIMDRIPDVSMKATLFTKDHFSCYAANLILPRSRSWPTSSKEMLKLFESCQFLDRFFDEKISANDFITEPVGTHLFTEIKDIAKDFIPSVKDEKGPRAILSKLDEVLKAKWQLFWDEVLDKSNNKPCKYRIEIIQDKLKFAFCSRAICLIAQELKLKSDDARVKWMHKVNLSRRNANLEAHQLLLKEFTLKQLRMDAASAQANDFELQSAITSVLQMYPPKVGRNTHGRDVGELALIFGIDGIPQRADVEKTAPAKFNMALCQAFNYQQRIEFIETILINSIKNWAKKKNKKNPLITDDTMQIVVNNLQNQRWQATNRDDIWKIIFDQATSKGHRLFKGLYVILEKQYQKHPEIVQSDQSKFVRAMVFRLANTPMPEQQEQKRSQRVLYTDMFQPPKTPVKTSQQEDAKPDVTSIPTREF